MTIEWELDLIRPLRKRRVFNYDLYEELWEMSPITPEEVLFTQYAIKFKPPLTGQMAIGNQLYLYPQLSSPITGSPVTPIANRIYYQPVIIPYPLKIIEFSVYITTRDDNKLVRLGIFSFERGKIEKHIYSNLIKLNTLGLRQVVANVNVSEGAYCLAFLTNSDGIAKFRRSPSSTFLLPTNKDSVESGITSTHYFNDISDFNNGFKDDPEVIMGNSNNSIFPPSVLIRVEV